VPAFAVAQGARRARAGEATGGAVQDRNTLAGAAAVRGRAIRMPRDAQRPLVQPRDAEHPRVALAPGAPQSEEQHLGTANQPQRRRVNQRLALPQRQALQKIVRRSLSAPVSNCHTARDAIRRESAQCREHHGGGGRREKNLHSVFFWGFFTARKGNTFFFFVFSSPSCTTHV
jgi:hypothetical protein